jgi:hypothetical protein
MKTLLATLLAVSLSLSCFSQSFISSAQLGAASLQGTAVSGGSCATTQDSNVGYQIGLYYGIGYNAAATYFAAPFTAGASYTSCQVSVYLQKVSSPTSTIYVAVYADSGSGPGTLLGTSAGISAAGLSTSVAAVPFTVTSAISSGSVYYVSVYTVNGNADYANYVRVLSASGIVSQSSYLSSNGSAWTVYGGYNCFAGTFMSP